MQGTPAVIEVLNEILTAELTAINQYFIHAKMLDNWGYERLAEKVMHESIDEMKDADKIIERILYLEGVPNLQRLGTVTVGETVAEQFDLDYARRGRRRRALQPGHRALHRRERPRHPRDARAPAPGRGGPRRLARGTDGADPPGRASRTTSPNRSGSDSDDPVGCRMWVDSPIEDYALMATPARRRWSTAAGPSTGGACPRSTAGRASPTCSVIRPNGHWTIRPAIEVERTERRYEPGTLVLETVHHTADGSVAVLDFMPLDDRSGDPPQVVQGRSGAVPMRMELIVRFDYGSITPWVAGHR